IQRQTAAEAGWRPGVPKELPVFSKVPSATQPEYLHPPYKTSLKRAPTQPLIVLPPTPSERSGPVFGHAAVRPGDADLTAQHEAAPAGERIVVSGYVLGEDGRPLRGALVELWQANAAGRYRHRNDQHNAPLDPNFDGCGRTITDAQGRYRFLTIKPGAYPWGNHHNAWRPAHIHFSLFGDHFGSRLVTQMYFPGDPLLAFDPIYQGTPEQARERMVSKFSLDITEEAYALGYDFDIVLRGPNETPMER